VKQTGERSAGNPHATFEVAGAGNRLTVWLVRHSQRKRGATARLNLRSRAPVLDPTKTEHQDADSLLRRGRQHGCFAITRASSRSCVVLEPAHAEKQHAREPGDLWSASARKGTRPVCEGAKPQGRRARSGGVGPHHTIDEPDEQRRAIFSGAWGEKGAGQGEHRSTQHQPDTERGTSVPGIERCARSSKEKEARTVHGFASPCERGFTSGHLLRLKAACSTRSRWHDMAGA